MTTTLRPDENNGAFRLIAKDAGKFEIASSGRCVVDYLHVRSHTHPPELVTGSNALNSALLPNIGKGSVGANGRDHVILREGDLLYARAAGEPEGYAFVEQVEPASAET